MKAFTLLELLVVMLLMSLAFGLLAPRLGHLVTSRQTTFPEALRALLQEARNAALTNHDNYLVLIESETRRFLFVRAPFDPENPKIIEKLVIPKEIEVKVARLIKIDGFQGILFLPDGTSSGGEIELINRSQARRELLVVPQSLFFVERRVLEP